jgi:hypothetical protein
MSNIARLLTALALCAVLPVLVPVPAGAHHPLERELSSMALLEGTQRSAFSTALAAAPPLEGVGENMRIVANVPLAPDAAVPGGANDEDFGVNGSDIELAGDYAYVGSYTQGMVLVNISSCADPTRPEDCKPFVESAYKCSGGQFDVQLNPEATVAVVAHESASEDKACHPGEEGAAIIDISDKRNPREVAFISDKKPDGSPSGVVVDGSHNVTLDWPNLYIDQYTQSYGKTEVFSLGGQPGASPSNPVKIGELAFPLLNGQSGFHDSFPLHRPDGKDLLYAASIQKSDIVDIDDPTKPRVLQTIFDPQIGISHGAEPNFNRKLLIVTDEYGGGMGVGACGGNPDAEVPEPLPGQLEQVTSLGAVHFYNLDAEGLVGAAGTDKAGIFNIVLQPNEPEQVANEAGCTSHVFWQAPDQNRMTIAWYGRGTRIVDFSDPRNPKQLGFFIPTGADTWSAKPHRGYIFAGDILRGMDVLLYTGEGGRAWPTTSGPAELQRGAVQRTGPGTGKPRVRGRRLVISRRARRARRGRAPVVVRCLQNSPCRGTLALRARGVRIGRRKLAAPARRRSVLRVRLNRRGRTLLRRHGKLRVVAIVRLEPEVGSASTRRIRVRASYPLIRR